MGGKWWYVAGYYIAPDNVLTTEAVVAAIIQQPCEADLLVDGDFNADLAATEGNACDKDITAALATVILEDMSAHFLPRKKPCFRDRRIWSMLCRGR